MTKETTGVAPTPHVRKAVLAITAAMAQSGIGKDRKNQMQGFMFRGIDDVLNALASLYVKEQVVVLPSYGERIKTEYESNKGGKLFNVTLSASYRIVSLVDGSEMISGPFFGEGMDSADKATNKAMSIAYKYFAIQTFAIPVVGNDDPDYESHSVASTQQRAAKAQQSRRPPAEPDPTPENETVAQAIDRLATTADGKKKLAVLIAQAYDVVLPDQVPADKTAEAIQRMAEYVAAVKAKGRKKAA